MANRATKTVGWVAVATTLISGFEGLYTYAYRDPVGIPTICFGHIEDVRMGDRKTVAECKQLLQDDMPRYDAGVKKCLKPEIYNNLSPQRHAALVSFTYNVGEKAFCSSTLLKKLNAKDPEACDELLKWTKAKGITLPGLVKRRKEERKYCMME